MLPITKRRRFKHYKLQTGCGIEACLERIGGKWKGILLHHLLHHGTARFHELQRQKPELSPRILTQQLRELERDALIVRTVYPVAPPRVEYSLSPVGESLRPLLEAMRQWGDLAIEREERESKPLKA